MATVVAKRQVRTRLPVAGWRQLLGVTCALLAATSVVLWPLLEEPGLPQTADLELHLVRAVELDILVREGWIYPRWAPDFAYGYGFPIFNFYAPLGSYLIASLHWLGLDFPVALKVAVVGVLLLYGPAMYVFARRFIPPIPATIAAIAYLYVPFRFRELFHQADFSQYLAMALLPLAFAALHAIVVHPTPWRFAGTVAATSGLILAHNITAFHAAGALALYALLLASAYGWRKLVWVALVGLSALLLTACFWLPALAEQHLVQLYRLRTDDFHFSHHFPSPQELFALAPVVDRAVANPAVPHNLGLTHLLVSLVSLLGLTGRARATSALRVHLGFGWLTLLLATFLMLPLSTPVWEHLPLLDYTEFPWRFRNLAGFGMATLIGLGVHWLLLLARPQARRQAVRVPPETTSPKRDGVIATSTDPDGLRTSTLPDGARSSHRADESIAQQIAVTSANDRRARLMDDGRPGEHASAVAAVLPALVALVVIVPNLVHLYPHVPFVPYDIRTAADIRQFELRTGAIGTTSAGEYYPVWTEERPGPSPDAGMLEPTSVPPGATATLVERSALRQRYQLNLPAAGRLTFNVLYFPGWEVRVDGQVVPPRPLPPHGLIGVDVPAGVHEVELAFTETPLRRGVEILSAATLVVGTVALVVWQRRKRGRRVDANAVEASTRVEATTGSLTVYQAAIVATAIVGVLVLKETLLDRWSVFSYRSPPGQVRGVMHPANETFGGQIRFLGHDLATPTVKPGEDVRVTLYWQRVATVPRDYRSIAKIVRRSTGEVVAQSDREHPGGMPTSKWRPDLYVRDEHVIHLPSDLAPMSYQIVVGLYDHEGFRTLPRDGASADDFLTLGAVTVAGARVAADRIAHPLSWQYDVGIAFLGYGYQTEAAPGETVDVQLFWRAEQPIAQNYTVFVHLLDGNQERVAQADGMPLNGDYPTALWAVGDEIEDHYKLALPEDLPPGSYHLLVGLYDANTGQRLEMHAPDGQRTHQLLLDPPITVRPPAAH